MQALCKALGARHSWQQQQERRRRSRAAGGGARAGGGAPRPLPPSTEKAKKVCVVGGGWAGFGAAKHLSEQQGYEVTLLDAAPNPGGLSAGWRTPQGRAVEAGVKGFWFQVGLPALLCHVLFCGRTAALPAHHGVCPGECPRRYQITWTP